MDFIAVLKSSTEIQSGISEQGNAWKRCTAIFETVENRPKTIAVNCMGNMVDIIKTKRPNTLLKVKLDAESHEYEGRWYTELRAWSIKAAYEVETQDGGQVNQAAQPQGAPAQGQPAEAGGAGWADNVPEPL